MTTSFSDWVDAFSTSMSNMMDRIINFVPNAFGAFLLILVGWIIGIILGKIVEKLLKLIGIQTLSEKAKIEDLIKRAEIKMSLSELLGSFVKWVVLIVAFVSAADILQLPQISEFLNKILAYIPNVAAAIGIILIGAVAAHFLSNVVSATVKAMNIGFDNFAVAVTKWSVWIFSILAAMYQLQIASGLIQTLFMGIVALIAISGGLAFGLGGQDAAKDILSKIKKQIQ
ncbi:MAG: hypothetical protein WCW17_02700 [Patescibacteria group bacterium]|jgi:hypothetical protein